MAEAKPTHVAYLVAQSAKEKDKAFLTEIGVGFAHKDNKGFDAVFKPGLSVHGRVMFRAIEEKPKQKPN